MKVLFKKQQHKLALEIVANYIIAKDALNKAFKCSSLTGVEFFDAIEKLTTNTVDLLTAVVGVDGVIYYTNRYNLGIGNIDYA